MLKRIQSWIASGWWRAVGILLGGLHQGEDPMEHICGRRKGNEVSMRLPRCAITPEEGRILPSQSCLVSCQLRVPSIITKLITPTAPKVYLAVVAGWGAFGYVFYNWGLKKYVPPHPMPFHSLPDPIYLASSFSISLTPLITPPPLYVIRTLNDI